MLRVKIQSMSVTLILVHCCPFALINPSRLFRHPRSHAHSRELIWSDYAYRQQNLHLIIRGIWIWKNGKRNKMPLPKWGKVMDNFWRLINSRNAKLQKRLKLIGSFICHLKANILHYFSSATLFNINGKIFYFDILWVDQFPKHSHIHPSLFPIVDEEQKLQTAQSIIMGYATARNCTVENVGLGAIH
jgi:hypothetical protein